MAVWSAWVPRFVVVFGNVATDTRAHTHMCTCATEQYDVINIRELSIVSGTENACCSAATVFRSLCRAFFAVAFLGTVRSQWLPFPCLSSPRSPTTRTLVTCL